MPIESGRSSAEIRYDVRPMDRPGVGDLLMLTTRRLTTVFRIGADQDHPLAKFHSYDAAMRFANRIAQEGKVEIWETQDGIAAARVVRSNVRVE